MIFVFPKYFFRQPPEQKVKSFTEVLHDSSVKKIKVNEYSWNIVCRFGKTERITKVFLLNTYNPKKPSIAIHHGAGETNHNIFLKFFGTKSYFDIFNVFFIKASHHASKRDYLENCMDTFDHWTETYVGSVLAVEETRKYCKDNGGKKFIVTGVSMGGIVSSLHYYYFGSANFYFPIVAYPNVGEIFLDKGYITVGSKRKKRIGNISYKRAFVIPEEIRYKRNKDNIKIYLGRYDEVVSYKKSIQFWEGYNVKTFNAGHPTIAFYLPSIRKDIIEIIS
jgi:hypothetical protein